MDLKILDKKIPYSKICAQKRLQKNGNHVPQLAKKFAYLLDKMFLQFNEFYFGKLYLTDILT